LRVGYRTEEIAAHRIARVSLPVLFNLANSVSDSVPLSTVSVIVAGAVRVL
jgi:hypothetical protein